MKILVTGATGFIGKPLVRALLLKGYDVTALVRDVPQAQQKLPYPMEFVSWDGTEKGLSDQVFDGVDGVIHLAGEPVIGKRWSEEQKARILNSRINTAEALVRKIEKRAGPSRPKVFLSGSATGYYGNRGDELLTEDSPAGTGFLSEVCQKWERVAAHIDNLGVRRVNIRTGAVLGRNGGMLKALLPVFKAGAGGPVGEGKQWVSWIHLEDQISAIIFLLENDRARGVFNGVGPEPVRNSEFSRYLAKTLHRPAFFRTPALGLRLALGEASEVVLESTRVLPEKLERLGFQFRFKRIDDALKDLCDVEKIAGQKEFYCEQWVPKSVNEIFPFFSNPNHLDEITPPFLEFKTVSKSATELQRGALFEHRLKIHGLRVRWTTRIEDWNPEKSFSDIQLKGPYKAWHHTHRFLPMKGGTLLTDRVLYQIPMGPLGEIVAGWKVRGDLSEIFKYRHKIIAERFGETEKRQSA